MSPTTISCRCRLAEGETLREVRIDLRLSLVSEVWMSIGDAGCPPDGSAVWRFGRWTVLTGGDGFAPQAIVGRALDARPWLLEPPPERRDNVLEILRSIAAAPDGRR